MGQPPRLPEIRLPWEKSVIYFVTLCVKDRRKVLANSETFEAIKATITQLRRWHILAGVVMPNHAHWIVGPRFDREISAGDFSNAFKRLLRKTLVEQDWEWQRGCFDRFFARTKTCTANGFTCKTIQCGTVWCGRQKTGRII